MKTKKRIVIVCIIAVILIGAGIGGYQYYQYDKRVRQDKVAHSSDICDSIAYANYFRLRSNMKSLSTVYTEAYFYPDKYTGVRYVKDGTGLTEATEGEIIYFPGERTEHFIENINEYLGAENIDLSVYDLKYPLTIDDVLTKRHQIHRAIRDMPSASIAVVFES